MTDEELARRLTEALDARIDRAASAPVSREILKRLPDPDTVGVAAVEAIPVRRSRWKGALAALLAVCMLGGIGLLAFQLAGRNMPPTDTIPGQSGTTEAVRTTEPTEAPLPELSFDEESKTLRIVGTEGYEGLDLAPYLSEALYLELEDDEFRFSADLAILREMLENQPYQLDIPTYLDKLDRSTSYIRKFIRDRVCDEKLLAQLRKPVHYTLKSRTGAYCTNSAEGIELELGPDALEYDARYALSLTKPSLDSWLNLGFAYWLGCVEPCNLVSDFQGTPTSPDSDYYYLADYFRLGGNGKTWEAKEKLLCMDACSWYILTNGRDWAGADPELRPIWRYPSSSRKEGDEGNDLSLFMAISLVNYLGERWGTDKVIACCYGVCSFEEAFGMSFSEARAAWEQSLLDRFGEGGEAP